MHIGFLASEYPLKALSPSGGIGTSIYNLAHRLVELGERVTVFVYGQQSDDILFDGDIQIVQIKNIYLPKLSWWLTRKKIERLVNRFVAVHNLDILEVPDWTGISAFMHLNCPVVMRLNGSDTYFSHIEQRPVKWWNRFQEYQAFKHADAIIAVSAFTGALTNRLFGLEKAYTVIPNGIDTRQFVPVADAIEAEEEGSMILYIGTLIRKKGVLEIPEIFNRVHQECPTARLVLAGGDSADFLTGNPSTWNMMYKQFSESALPGVSYLGRLPYEEIRALLCKAQVCIFPSYAEACPVSWLEAMAMGKAIVASDMGWAKELIGHGQEGYLVAPSDHKLFANQVIQVLKSDSIRQALGNKAHIRCLKGFDSMVVAEKSREVYDMVVKR